MSQEQAAVAAWLNDQITRVTELIEMPDEGEYDMSKAEAELGVDLSENFRKLTAERRRFFVERHFPVFDASELGKEEPWQAAGLSGKDAMSARQCAVNHKNGIVKFRGLRKPKSGWRENQKTLLEIKDIEGLRRALHNRREEIMSALSDEYLAVRAAFLRTWVHFVVEAKGESPWRTHWPADKGDDALMEEFVILASLRYTTWTSVAAARTHVVEFHRSMRLETPTIPPSRTWLMSAQALGQGRSRSAP